MPSLRGAGHIDIDGASAAITISDFAVDGDGIEPMTVSPGATDRVTGVEVSCPTFSWQAVPGAVGYEVVVYELPPRVEVVATGTLVCRDLYDAGFATCICPPP